MLLIRRLGAVVLVIAAISIWFSLKPSAKPAESADFYSEITAAMATDTINQANNQYSAQQAVANGWVARDLLEIIAREQNAALSPQSAPRDERIPAELLLVVLGMALLAGTTPGPAPEEKRPVPPPTTGT